ncbi:hypothetical protein NKJ52_29305 [Mesorhizobium australicum]|uniref:hypothetical protein n=1 Tax=Mesorhizobium australicum TaxID=536018 RepID=UPI00333CB456
MLDFLGYQLTLHPLTTAQAVEDACASALSIDLSVPVLSAREKVDEAITHWEALGVIERLHHDGEQAFTFVHKTIGEYVAARYVLRLKEMARRTAFADMAQIPEWSEVLEFAATLGGATEVCQALLEAVEGDAGYKGVLQALAKSPWTLSGRFPSNFAKISSRRQLNSFNRLSALDLLLKRPKLLTPDRLARLLTWYDSPVAGKRERVISLLKEPFMSRNAVERQQRCRSGAGRTQRRRREQPRRNPRNRLKPAFALLQHCGARSGGPRRAEMPRSCGLTLARRHKCIPMPDWQCASPQESRYFPGLAGQLVSAR